MNQRSDFNNVVADAIGNDEPGAHHTEFARTLNAARFAELWKFPEPPQRHTNTRLCCLRGRGVALGYPGQLMFHFREKTRRQTHRKRALSHAAFANRP